VSGWLCCESCGRMFPNPQNPSPDTGTLPAFTYRIDLDRRVIVVVFYRQPTFPEWRECVETLLADPRYRDAFPIVSDRRQLTEPMSRTMVEQIAQYTAARADHFGNRRLALVAGTPAEYGMARMVGTLMETADSRIALHVFTKMDAALAWALESDPPRQS
jgi:hypothetical protein